MSSPVNPINMADRSGVINTTVVSHVQAAAANQVPRASFSAAVISELNNTEDAIEKVNKESGQVSTLTSSAVAPEIKDDESENSANQFEHFGKDEEENSEEELAFEEEIQENPENVDPFVGNILNLKV